MLERNCVLHSGYVQLQQWILGQGGGKGSEVLPREKQPFLGHL